MWDLTLLVNLKDYRKSYEVACIYIPTMLGEPLNPYQRERFAHTQLGLHG